MFSDQGKRGMKIIAATRTYNDQYFIETFVRHYLSLGVDEILVFDSASQDNTVKIVREIGRKYPQVELSISSPDLRHTSDTKEAESCNFVLQSAIQRTMALSQPVWWIFPDIDEFLENPPSGLHSFFSGFTENIIRGVFLEWYLDPSKAIKSVSSKEMLRLALKGRLKGKQLLAMEDPFYKDCILKLDPQVISSPDQIKTTLGNHRLVINGKVTTGKSSSWALFHHLRGVPFIESQRRIRTRIGLFQAGHDEKYDAQLYLHFQKLQNQLRDYQNYYSKLLSDSDLRKQAEECRNFDSEESKFDRFIEEIYLAREEAYIGN
jgi:glycosyltransferase involved in cell wall biosynthesis